MIITDTTLVGYATLNGTWSIQLALLIGSITLVIVFPADEISLPPNILLNHPDEVNQLVLNCRRELIALHIILLATNIVTHSERFGSPVMKYLITFAGMLYYSYEILSVGLNNYITGTPSELSASIPNAATITWFRVELAAWLGCFLSNMIFMFIRSQAHC